MTFPTLSPFKRDRRLASRQGREKKGNGIWEFQKEGIPHREEISAEVMIDSNLQRFLSVPNVTNRFCLTMSAHIVGLIEGKKSLKSQRRNKRKIGR